MTREEAIEAIKFGHCDDMYYRKEYEEAVDMAIKALEQEPCEDAISRQAAIDALRDAENHAFNTFYKGLIKAHKIIANLPSFNPQPKMGRWIPDDTICEDTLYRCSNCDNVYYSDYGDVKDMGYNFCPNCGAKMESDGEEGDRQ